MCCKVVSNPWCLTTGAGTIMEGLGLKKPMVVVINQTLMDDHQQELAHALADKVSPAPI